jgi:hypothetical protein
MVFTDRFPADMLRKWLAQPGPEPTGLYEACALALSVAHQTDSVAYGRMFGSPAAVRAATDLCALRYGSPGDARRAVEYGAVGADGAAGAAGQDPVASVVACMLDGRAPGATVPPRLIDRAAIETIPELAPIVRSVRALFGTARATRAATLAAVADEGP